MDQVPRPELQRMLDAQRVLLPRPDVCVCSLSLEEFGYDAELKIELRPLDTRPRQVVELDDELCRVDARLNKLPELRVVHSCIHGEEIRDCMLDPGFKCHAPLRLQIDIRHDGDGRNIR